MSALTQVTSGEFDAKVAQAAKPVLLKFTAEWCGPCKQLAPVISQLAGELGTKLDFYEVDVDASPDLAARFGAMSVPMLLLFKGGRPVEQWVGYMSKAKLSEKLQAHLT